MRRSACLAASLVAAVLALDMAAARADAPEPQRHVDKGVAMELTIATQGDGPPAAGHDVRVALRLSDAASGAPIGDASPAAWLSGRRPGQAPDDGRCARKVAAFAGGSLIEQPDADLTGFALLVLNRDPTISVIDPRSGYGGSRFLAMLPLDAPGADWAIGGTPPRIYVSEPDAGRIAVFDAERWTRVATIATPGAPGPLVLDDHGVLWAAGGSTSPAGGASDLSAFGPGGAVLARIPLGPGPHRLALTGDGKFLVASSAGDGSVSVIDTATRTAHARLAVPGVNGLAVSPLSGFAYGAGGDGGIAVIDPARGVQVASIATSRASAIGIAPGGRWGFASSPDTGQVTIFDTVTSRAVQSVAVADRPYAIGFTGDAAYIRRRDSEQVTLIPLGPLTEQGHVAGLAEFPGGERPAAIGAAGTAAAMMVAAPGEPAMLLASPAERTVQYYHEGMAAPSGSFEDAGHQPAAVAVLDRSLRQTATGTYSAPVRLTRAGTYDVAVLLDRPRVVHCFTLDVAPNGAGQDRQVAIEPLSVPAETTAGQKTIARFRLVRPKDSPNAGPEAINAMAVLIPGTWHAVTAMIPEPDATWRMEFTLPLPGQYLIALQTEPDGPWGTVRFSIRAVASAPGATRDVHG